MQLTELSAESIASFPHCLTGLSTSVIVADIAVIAVAPIMSFLCHLIIAQIDMACRAKSVLCINEMSFS